MRRVNTLARPFVFSLLAVAVAGAIGAWTTTTARSAGVPSGPAPSLASAAPSPSPKASSGLPSGATIQAPTIKLPHLYVNEGSYLVDKSYIGGPIDCGTTPAKWAIGAVANLKGGFSAEKAYFQEKDAFGTPAQIGLSPETNYRACINFVVNVGHYTGDLPASVFFITARHNAGGPMYCVTNIGGTLPSGNFGTSYAGGPILSPDQCAALPVFVPPAAPFSPSMAVRPAIMPLPSPSSGAAGSAFAPALLKAATPYALGLTNDLMTCTQHTNDEGACEFDIVGSRAIMVWALGTSCGTWPSCTTHVAGYKIYNVPPGQTTRAPLPKVTQGQSAISASAQAALASPTPTPNPMLNPIHAIPLPYRVLVATVTDSDHKGGIATAAGVYATSVKTGRCYVVVAYLQNGDESDDSPQYCVVGPVTVGPLQLDLTPSALVTAYGHRNMCVDTPPFSHPGGSALAGYTVTAGTNDYPPGYRCLQYQGLAKFDLSAVSPPVVYKATLQFSKVNNYKANGTIYPGPGTCIPIVYDTTDDWASAASDPRAGLAAVHNKLGEGSGVDVQQIDVTAAVNTMVQSGVNDGFVVYLNDWNGPSSSCFTAWGDFHLYVTAFGHH